MKRVVVWGLLLFLLVALFVLDIVAGSVDIPLASLFDAMCGDETSVYHTILVDIRLPKAITAFFVGGSLALSGLWMQTLFRNPLVGPYVLGISSGATLGVAIYIFLFSLLGISAYYVSSWGMALSAMLGASILFGVVLLVSFRLPNSVSLLIAGVMLGSVATSVVSLLQNISDPDSVKLFVNWTLGSLSGVTWEKLSVMVPLVCVGLLMTPLLCKPLDAMLLGDEYAESVGVRVRRTRVFTILSATVLTGVTTAFTGPIGFLGLAVPHLVRGVMKSSAHWVLAPASFLTGAVLMLSCDIISQWPNNGYVLPINALTALVGAPVVLWIILRGRG